MAKNAIPRRAPIMALLKEAPALPSDVAYELRMAEGRANNTLLKMYQDGRIARRPFSYEGTQQRWLYLLKEHQTQLEG